MKSKVAICVYMFEFILDIKTICFKLVFCFWLQKFSCMYMLDFAGGLFFQNIWSFAIVHYFIKRKKFHKCALLIDVFTSSAEFILHFSFYTIFILVQNCFLKKGTILCRLPFFKRYLFLYCSQKPSMLYFGVKSTVILTRIDNKNWPFKSF